MHLIKKDHLTTEYTQSKRCTSTSELLRVPLVILAWSNQFSYRKKGEFKLGKGKTLKKLAN